MPGKTLYPSLDPDGWVAGSEQIVDYMFSDFFLTDYSQTALFKNGVSSFAYILEENRGDLQSTATALKSALELYFSKQFSNVESLVYHEQVAGSNNRHNLNIMLTFEDSVGKLHNLSRLVNLSGSKVDGIIKVINEG